MTYVFEEIYNKKSYYMKRRRIIQKLELGSVKTILAFTAIFFKLRDIYTEIGFILPAFFRVIDSNNSNFRLLQY